MNDISTGTIEERMTLDAKIPQAGNALPDFLKAAVNLGRELYRSSAAGRPRTIFLTVPSRDFLSVSISLGAAEAAFSCGNSTTYRPSVGDKVIALPAEGGYYIATFEGEAADKYAPGRMRTSLGLKGSQKVSMYSDKLTLMEHPKGANASVGLSTLNHNNAPPPQLALVQAAFGLASARDLYLPVPAASIVGIKSWIEDDMRDFAFKIDGVTNGETSLDQILLSKPALNFPPIVELLATAQSSIRNLRSHVTILDGAGVPLRHGLDLGPGSQVVIFDATTPESTLELALSACSGRVAFLEQDPKWPPIKHQGFKSTERASFLRRH